MTLNFILLLAAFFCFILSAVNPPWPRPNLIGLGLAFWVLTFLIHKA